MTKDIYFSCEHLRKLWGWSEHQFRTRAFSDTDLPTHLDNEYMLNRKQFNEYNIESKFCYFINKKLCDIYIHKADILEWLNKNSEYNVGDYYEGYIEYGVAYGLQMPDDADGISGDDLHKKVDALKALQSRMQELEAELEQKESLLASQAEQIAGLKAELAARPKMKVAKADDGEEASSGKKGSYRKVIAYLWRILSSSSSEREKSFVSLHRELESCKGTSLLQDCEMRINTFKETLRDSGVQI